MVRKCSALHFCHEISDLRTPSFQYHHQMVFHITVPSNILIDMTTMPLGTLGIKFRDSQMFIRWNTLNRPMSYKLNYTNQTILYAFAIYQQRFLIK